jgi:hypothetical protein
MGRAQITHETITADQPLRLADACNLFFAGALTPAALRLEASRGNLAMMRIAGKDFVTPAAIEDMKRKCRVERNPHTSSSEPSPRSRVNPAPDASGSSRTDQSISAQDALSMKLQRLSGGSRNTSARSTTPSSETAELLRFPSQTS